MATIGRAEFKVIQSAVTTLDNSTEYLVNPLLEVELPLSETNHFVIYNMNIGESEFTITMLNSEGVSNVTAFGKCPARTVVVAVVPSGGCNRALISATKLLKLVDIEYVYLGYQESNNYAYSVQATNAARDANRSLALGKYFFTLKSNSNIVITPQAKSLSGASISISCTSPIQLSRGAMTYAISSAITIVDTLKSTSEVTITTGSAQESSVVISLTSDPTSALTSGTPMQVWRV